MNFELFLIYRNEYFDRRSGSFQATVTTFWTTTTGPGADCRLCVMKLGNAEVSPTHDTVVTDTSYVRTLISAASCKDFAWHYARLVILLDIDVGAVLGNDVLITHGTQEYAKGAGRWTGGKATGTQATN